MKEAPNPSRTISLIRSPFARQRVMLSSRTVFMFSIHKASMGPSKTVHLEGMTKVTPSDDTTREHDG